MIAFAPGEHGLLRGSARSVPGLNIRDALEAVSTRNPGLIPQFGGHAMAAGLSLAQGDFLRFQGLFADEVDQRLGGAQGIADILTDGPIAAAEINVATARQLRDAGPWGSGFSEPRFDGLFRVADCRLLAGDHLKLRVVPEDGEQAVDAIAFRQAESLGGKRPEQVRLVFGLDLNDYRGQQSAQLLVDLLEPE